MAIVSFTVKASDGNLALGKPVTGLTLEQGTLDTLPNLVDGKAGTCADSGPLVKQPSFQIDLGRPRRIKSVKLVFPSDCKQTLSKTGCGYDATVIKISNDKDGGGNDCAKWEANVFQPNGEISVECKDGVIKGRYVTLTKEQTQYQRAIYLCELQVYGRESGTSAPDGNFALGKPVTGLTLLQGTLDTLPNLVDGKAGTCADSGPLVKQPSFQIDLGRPRRIKSVKLVFPSDCKQTLSKTGCGYDATVIKISNDKDGGGNVCARWDANVFQPNGEISVECKDGVIKGRYVTLTKEQTQYQRAIYLCELQVYGRESGTSPDGNFALGKPVTGLTLLQGTLDTLPNLVDGKAGTCADSGPLVNQPSFQIDLGRPRRIKSVKLVFPSDCKQTLSKTGCGYDATVIKISNDKDGGGNVCARWDANVFQPNGEISVECKDGVIKGRYVTLTKEQTQYQRAIYLCELQVYGRESGTSPDGNFALGKPVTGLTLLQGTLDTLPNLVDGKAGTCADSGPLVNQPSFQIDLGRPRRIKSVKLVFPSDCKQTLSKTGCGYDATVIKISNDKDGGGNICAKWEADVFQPNGEISVECKDGVIKGRYVTLTKEQTQYQRAIYLCELQVYGRRKLCLSDL
ncbi:uncharacterized protein [Ptychodera flava]|uniref:uncharacterized protein n=1 Tax=Ptychodera flava TaxID=63121 RepID=UPI00396A7091